MIDPRSSHSSHINVLAELCCRARSDSNATESDTEIKAAVGCFNEPQPLDVNYRPVSSQLGSLDHQHDQSNGLLSPTTQLTGSVEPPSGNDTPPDSVIYFTPLSARQRPNQGWTLPPLSTILPQAAITPSLSALPSHTQELSAIPARYRSHIDSRFASESNIGSEVKKGISSTVQSYQLERQVEPPRISKRAYGHATAEDRRIFRKRAEQIRRDQLKKAFDVIKNLVPRKRKAPPKDELLNEATSYIRQLQMDGAEKMRLIQEMEAEIALLTNVNCKLNE
ncbi:UNVERIFIED_CONTAM: hypothetical protein HDU68_009669 [Siphonaria sp. JEL0065]|nr:hypothetical protein HDU68_009669 [Siphonaria sp. JEL0065]